MTDDEPTIPKLLLFPVFVADYLNPNDLRKVYEAVFDMRAKWKQLGLQLNILPGSLDAIDQKCKGNPDDCLYEVLKDWLSKEEAANWEQLVTALRQESVGETRLAYKIEKDLDCQNLVSKLILYSRYSTVNPHYSKPS